MRTVGELVGTQTVVSTGPNQSVFEVAGIMAAKNIGALAVVSGEKVVGIVSERDILGRVVAAGADPKTTKVEATMTKKPVTVEASETPLRALELLKQKKFRHLPVLEKGKLVGILSLRDLLQVQVSTQESELQVLSELPNRQFE